MTATPPLASRDRVSPIGDSHPQSPLQHLTTAHIATLSLDGVRRALEQVAATQRTLDAVRMLLNGRLRQLSAASPAVMPEQVIVRATSVSRPDARRDMQRVDTLEKFPHIREAVMSGDISTHHVDVITRAVRHLDGNALRLFADNEDRLVGIARHTSPDNFSRVVQQTALRSEHDSGVDTTERQRRRTWLRHWVDNDSGMVRLHGELDPESGLRLVGRMQNAVRTLFNSGDGHEVSGAAPDKPAHLNALALVALVCDSTDSNVVSIAGASSRTDVSVVVDIDTLRRGLHEKSVISTGTDIALPVETVRRLACEARIIPVVMSSAGVVLDMGRATRIATTHQRKALEAMHPTCAIPRCIVPVARCEPHHIDYWTNGGPTDLDNLIPLCSEHHRCVHEGGWRVGLDTRTRRVTVGLPGQ